LLIYKCNYLLQDYRVDLLQELVDSRQQEVEMFQAQYLAQQEETVKYKSLVVEAGVELEVLITIFTSPNALI